ncbi:TonB-dependent receptor [Wenyingzhuangia sp. IMCC45574]
MRVLIFLCSIVALNSFSQKIRVVDLYTNKRVEGATVECTTTGAKKITNPKGEVVFKKNGKVICVYHINYDTLRVVSDDKYKEILLKPRYEDLEKVVLSVSRIAEKKQKIPEHIEILTKKRIDQISAQTSADLLGNIPGVRIQKSQLGGGSPVIRGMESNRVLLVVDGVRMNNAIYRKGHLQNSITISPLALERTEVVFGPTSVIYGSDALGGVVHYYTKGLDYSWKPKTKNNIFYRHSTVNNEHSTSVSSYNSHKKWASYTNVSFSSFDNLRMGSSRTHGYEDWGKIFRYSKNTEDAYFPSSSENKNPNIQRNSGYNQLDILQKIKFPLHKKIDLLLNGQYSTSSDIPNYGKLREEVNSGDLKFAEWRYGPQKRLLLSAQASFRDYKSLIENGTITLAYQNIDESRINRQFNSLNRTSRFEDVDVFSLNSDFYKSLTKKGDRKLFYGFEMVHNNVASNAKGETLAVDLETNKVVGVQNNFEVDTRYPDGGGTYTSTAVYTSYRQRLDKRNTLNIGLRLTNTHLTANWDRNIAVPIPGNKISLNNTALTGSVGYICRPNEQNKLSFVLSKGFRSPNLDDIGKIRSKSSKLTVPNTSLTPEHLYSAEVGFAKISRKKRGEFSANVFYTLLDDYISRTPTSIYGNSINYDGDLFVGDEILANTNQGQAYIYGGTVSAFYELTKSLKSNFSCTYTKGRSYDTHEPLSSIPPFYGNIALSIDKKKYNVALDYRFSFRKILDDYNITEGVDNVEFTPEGVGTPAWHVVNLNSNYFLKPYLKLQVQVQNILDVHYQEFASTISAPGRNISAAVEYTF